MEEKQLSVQSVCPHAAKTDCTRKLHGKSCCEAVQHRVCLPPKEVWKEFAQDNDGWDLVVRVKIAMGIYADAAN